MAEIGKGVTAGKLAINVQKRLTRAQEKVLQKLGKADETRDVAFEEMVSRFNQQMAEGTKLQKDLKAYQAAVKTMHDASRRLQDCLADMYEPDWFGKEEMDSLAEDTDTLWLEYQQNITDKSLLCIDTYLARFPDIKARIAKRDRKMVDFDSARHHFGSLQKGKKKDEAKIAKPAALLEMAAPSWAQGLISAHQVAQTNLSYNQAEEELGRAQRIFEELNVELQDELPVLWDSRVGVYVNTFQNLAGHQEKFHREMGKLTQNLNDIMTKLEEQKHRKPSTATATTERRRKADGITMTAPPRATPSRAGTTRRRLKVRRAGATTERTPPTRTRSPAGMTAAADGLVIYGLSVQQNPSLAPVVHSLQVKAIHDYAATDGDELELKIGDVVLVVAFDNPDEQDDGWLMGLLESNWLQKKDVSTKGVFPENFTQKV
uniref:Myc box-dependent-interacting protein 1 n=1 Tax=Salarias fasciatus TaxID=181472 RepID=A0A672J5T9_SALFA